MLKKEALLMKTITKETLISDALKEGNVDAMAEVLFNFGMHCLGCSLARGETIEQAAAAHGVDAEEMVKSLNEAAAL
jgi:hydrid cluster protein-associated redox disulfide domain